jgi:hypothetical protein
VASHLPDEERARLLGECLDSIGRITDTLAIGRPLELLAAHLTPLLVARAIQIAQDIHNWQCVAVLALRLPVGDQGPHLGAVLDHTGDFRPDDLPGLFELIAPHLPPGLVARAREAAARIADLQIRRRVYSTLSPRLPDWAKEDAGAAREAWIAGLEGFAASPRPEFLRDLRDLVPLALGLHQQDAAALADAVLDVSRWWP